MTTGGRRRTHWTLAALVTAIAALSTFVGTTRAPAGARASTTGVPLAVDSLPQGSSAIAGNVATRLPTRILGRGPMPEYPAIGRQQVTGGNGTIIENLHVSVANGNCIDVRDSTNVTIRNAVIGPCPGGAGIKLSSSTTVTIENVWFIDVGYGVSGAGVSDVSIANSSFNGVKGVAEPKAVYFEGSSGIRVVGNAFVDAGRNFVQFNRVSGASNQINDNIGEAVLGQSVAIDFISLFQTSGTPASPVEVRRNRLRNGGPSDSGSGIMSGDGNGSYQLIEGNVLVDPGQVGIGIAGGDHITVRNNRVYSSSHAWSNVGIYQAQYDATSPNGACHDNVVSDNLVNWTNAKGQPNGFYQDTSKCTPAAGLATNNFTAAIDASIW